MQSTSIPPKFPVPWANSAGAANVRTIPRTSQVSIQAGAASLEDGFPPLNLVPVSAGGVPPFGQDMNGILKQVTQWLQWSGAGGAVRYDSAFAAAVGGYPAGATIMSNSGHAVYESLADNNLGDPNLTSVNWRVLSSVWSSGAWTASGSANAQTVTLVPAPTSLNQLSGIPLTIISQGTNTTATTINFNGLGAVSILVPGGLPIAGGTLLTGYPFQIVLQGSSSAILMSRSNTFFDASGNGLSIQGTGGLGANLLFLGNGANPNKIITVSNGNLFIQNNSHNSILNLDDSGNLATTGGYSGATVAVTGAISAGTSLNAGTSVSAANGNVTANNGRLRASLGAIGSGDNNAAPILSDFVGGVGFTTIPSTGWGSGLIFQWGIVTVPENNTPTTFNFPEAFPTQCLAITISYGALTPPAAGSVGAQSVNRAQFLATNTSTVGGNNGCFFIAIGV